MDNNVQDYLFDLQGYLVLKNAISSADLREMNQWIDDHASYVQEPWSTDGDRKKKGRWIGHIETHTYNEENGVNFQSIIEGGPVFERLIDHPAWIDLVKKYIHSSANGLSIHENFLNVRGPGGYLHIHCGGHVPLSYLTFRQNNTGEWLVGQINVLMALNDIGEGDGPPVLIPGSHKCTEIHPRLEMDGRGLIYDSVSGKPAGTAIAMQEMYLKAGDVLLFTDAITHGSAERTNPGYRRTIVYRYSPKYVRERFNYQISEELLQRLTPERRAIIVPNVPRRPPSA
ncbi:MAG: hypothetical protein F4Z57_15965 [Gemmatimonadetes bacterium]|nr:hypothetical protein [Gemmatimonadota bacterium]MYC69992.1 hypothetical protein [Gemmatimonadota bacterium]